MFSFLKPRTPAQRFADEVMEYLQDATRRVGREGESLRSVLAAAPDHLRAAGRSLDRPAIGRCARSAVMSAAIPPSSRRWW